MNIAEAESKVKKSAESAWGISDASCRKATPQSQCPAIGDKERLRGLGVGEDHLQQTKASRLTLASLNVRIS